MPESSLKQTPIATDPVGSLVGEFLEERRKERQEEKARNAPRKRNPLVIPLLVAIVLAVWIGPSFMPRQEPELTPETVEQGARITVYLASLRVRNYLEANRRLPASLSQVGVDTTGLVYMRRPDNVFELSTRVRGTKLTYRSTMPDSVFLGNARLRGIS